MKLDENVCRGSLIIHHGHSYAVVGKCKATDVFGRVAPIEKWKVVRVDAEQLIVEGETFVQSEEVDCFFPGVAYELPGYIK